MIYELKTDGASQPNPGHGGAGAVLFNFMGEAIKKRSVYLGEPVTNNEAEYSAVLIGLEMIPEDAKQVVLYTDSQLVVKQVNREWDTSDPRMEKLAERPQNYTTVHGPIDNFEIEHIPREENELADRLAGEAIKNKETADRMPDSFFPIPLGNS